MRRAALALVAVAALAAISIAGARAWGAVLAAQGRAALTTALNLEDPVLRAQGLANAQSRLMAGARFAGGDSQIWGMLANVRLLQATADGAGASVELLAAARANADRAAALSPADPRPLVLGAEVALAEPGAERAAEAAAKIARSYVLRPLDPALGVLRTEVAFSAWTQMPADVQTAALSEACAIVARSPEARDRISARSQSAIAVQEGAGADLAGRLRRDVLNPSCLSGNA